jgi:hypothetical protein
MRETFLTCIKYFASTTQMMESRLNLAAIHGLAKKVKARGEGSARPVVSSRMWSWATSLALALLSNSAKALPFEKVS